MRNKIEILSAEAALAHEAWFQETLKINNIERADDSDFFKNIEKLDNNLEETTQTFTALAPHLHF